MSSHREAPEISKDPVADSTDLYAFVSPDQPDSVTIIANYVPLEGPDGGPNFYEFGDDVLYTINIDNDNDADADISFQFRFQNSVQNPNTFLYNTGPITSLTDPHWNRRQTYSVTQVNEHGGSEVLGTNLASPPCNIGPLSTPSYTALAGAAVHTLGGGIQVFAGQRAEGFFVDLGSIFDLGILRPFEQAHTTFGLKGTGLGKMASGVNATKALNVHTIALQIPMELLTPNGRGPRHSSSSNSVIGVWTAAYRQKVRVRDGGSHFCTGPYVQVSRLGNPLINEVVIPMGKKDYWNGEEPSDDSQFASSYTNPELAQLLPVLYPGVFPNLAAYNMGSPNRADLVAVLLTGIPAGVVPGFQNFTGTTQADLLRLNMAIPPSKSPVNTGLIGGDPAGFPNGRRVFDDVVTIEVRAIAGAILGLVDTSFKPDKAAGAVNQGLTSSDSDTSAKGTEDYLSSFPYLGVPHSGFEVRGVTAEGRHGPTAGARVVLDIGPHAGALVVYAGDELAGEEIEIRPHGGRWQGAHTEVRARRVDGGVVHAGLFDKLAPGRYDLRLRPGTASAPCVAEITVAVTAGAVSDASLATPVTVPAAGDTALPNSDPVTARNSV